MALNDFTLFALSDVSIVNPTSLDFGPDGRLYVSQQDGAILALTIQAQTNAQGLRTGFTVSSVDRIGVIQTIPNHDDFGNLEPASGKRQVTGIAVTGTADSVVIYVSSSDSRIAGAAGGEDVDLDTNSGILSRVTINNPGTPAQQVEKVDLIRGLPRSEENHATNGMVVTTDSNGNEVIYLTVGGNTNKGAQSNNFSFTSEYYYSSSVVKIDLSRLQAYEDVEGVQNYLSPHNGTTVLSRYIYDLPTLDDPTRANANGISDPTDAGYDGIDVNDVFGGNDGLNQAIADPLGIVTVYSGGYRNHYDLALTEEGRLYTFDNGPNTNWGGEPVNADGVVIVDQTSQVDHDGDGNLNEPDGLPDNGPATTRKSELQSNFRSDQLHLIDVNVFDGNGAVHVDGTAANSAYYFSRGFGYYGGHPVTIRAEGAQAGIYLYTDTRDAVGPGIPLNLVQNGTDADGHPLYTLVATPGPDIDLSGMIPNLDRILPVDGNGDPIRDPRQGVFNTPSNVGTNDDNFDGSIFAVNSSTNGLTEYRWSGNSLDGSLLSVSFNGNISAFSLNANGGVAGIQTRGIGGNPLDVIAQDDGEIFAGTIWVATHGSDNIYVLDPGAGIAQNPDPTDRDKDGVEDSFDPFAADPSNGLANRVSAGSVLVWSFDPNATFPNQSPALFDGATGLYNGFDIGFTGIMTSGAGLPETLFDPNNLIAGGAIGAFQIKQVEAGSPFDSTLRSGYQFGVTAADDVGTLTVHTRIDSFFDEVDEVDPAAKLLQGLTIGAGTMNDFAYIAAARLSNGMTGVEVAWQFDRGLFGGGLVSGSSFYALPNLANATDTDEIELAFDIDMTTGSATPRWAYTIAGVGFTSDGFIDPTDAVTLDGAAIEALYGENNLNTRSGGTASSGLAVGMIASNSSASVPGGGEIVAAVNSGGPTITGLVNGQSVTFQSDVSGTAAGWKTGTSAVGTAGTSNIQGTELDQLHVKERYGKSWGYDIPIANGVYQVDLYFAETYWGTSGGGSSGGNNSRTFRALIEGSLVDVPGAEQDDVIDIFELAPGPNFEYVLTSLATVTDGILDVDFTTLKDNAKLSGLLVRDASGGSTFAADWADITVTGTLGTSVGTTQRIEAEDMTILQGFQLQNNVHASGGQFLQAGGTGLQRAQVIHSGPDGSYTLKIGLFDENDGASNMQVLVNGNQLADFVWNLNPGGAFADPSSFVLRSFSGINLAAGDVITIVGRPNGGEPLRTDFIDLTFNGRPGTGNQPLSASIPVDVESIFESSGLAPTGSYGVGVEGTARVTISPGGSVQRSSFGADSFQVTNTGPKKIVGVFFDARGSILPDVVFDADGSAGDDGAKPWGIDTFGGTGAIDPGAGAVYQAYHLPGDDPDPSDPGTSGGFLGALIRFSATTDGGFTNGETVGASGDMDHNSIANTAKSGPSGVDTGSIPPWDVGGVSGAEMIGGRVYVQFDDGTFGEGTLFADGSQSGAVARIRQIEPQVAVQLAVNGVQPGNVGTYDSAPSVVVTGPAGATVRVVMMKGHQPVANPALVATVEERLENQPIPSNNAAEFQFVTVVIPASGTIDISSLIDFDDFLNTTPDFAGSDKLPLAFVAAAVDPGNTSTPLGPVTAPVYLVPEEPGTGGGDPIVIEAESMTRVQGFAVASNPHASGGAFLQATGSGEARASIAFAGESGTYEVSVRHFDESDGQSSLSLRVGGTVRGNLIWDQNPGSAFADPSSAVVRSFGDIAIAAGELVEIVGFANGGEPLRTDVLTFTPSSGVVVPPPATPFRLEAEALTITQGFVAVSNSNASGGRFLQAGGTGPQSAQFVYSGPADTFDLRLHYFDENDGQSDFAVLRNGIEVDSFIWNADAGNAFASPSSRASHLTEDVTLAAGDVLTFRGVPDAGEPLRFDWIDFLLA